ncbi:MAG: protein-arginine deiminase family protein [Myxococcaceae bacterium]
MFDLPGSRRLSIAASLVMLCACGSQSNLATLSGQTPDLANSNKQQLDAGVVEAEREGPRADLRADVDRDGVVSLTGTGDEQNEDTWDATRGAIFLPNLDDDSGRCAYAGDSETSDRRTDAQLDACFDGADQLVNGTKDLLDMALLKVAAWATAPDNAIGTLQVSTAAAKSVRLFKKEGSEYVQWNGAADQLTGADLRAGVDFYLEGTDVVRSAAVWDGFVDVTLKVTAPSVDLSDVVRLRVAPVLLSHHLQQGTGFTVSAVQATEFSRFRSALNGLLSPLPLYQWGSDDPWNQDYFETGYATMPGANGQQHAIRFSIRSANQISSSALRTGGRIIYKLRGENSAALAHFDRNDRSDDDSLNSFGNTETIPPHTFNGVSYPMGRIYRGMTAGRYPDRAFQKMLEDQKVQPPVYVDTAWLIVGHVDETMSFVKTNSARGWAVVLADPMLAISLLQSAQQSGRGATKLFTGKQRYGSGVFGGFTDAEVTIDQALALPSTAGGYTVRAYSAAAASKIEGQLSVLKSQTGITEADVLRVPVLFERDSGLGIAYNPGQVNGLYSKDDTFIAPDPFGPVLPVNGGAARDLFKAATEDALAKAGVTVKWIDDWYTYHLNLGEVHCGTNSIRAIPQAKWWESGR